MCNCIKLTQDKGELVKKHHTRICVTIPFDPSEVSRVVLKTEKTFDAPRGTKAVTLIASYCPFCGEKYQDLEEKPEGG
jgi:hypothetical protein